MGIRLYPYPTRDLTGRVRVLPMGMKVCPYPGAEPGFGHEGGENSTAIKENKHHNILSLKNN
jgi:hypothetical protein